MRTSNLRSTVVSSVFETYAKKLNVRNSTRGVEAGTFFTLQIPGHGTLGSGPHTKDDPRMETRLDSTDSTRQGKPLLEVEKGVPSNRRRVRIQ